MQNFFLDFGPRGPGRGARSFGWPAVSAILRKKRIASHKCEIFLKKKLKKRLTLGEECAIL